jgi:hypothetical protein
MQTRSLPVKLTDDELLIRGSELSASVQKLADLERDKKAVDAQLKKDIDEADSESQRLAKIARNKEEYREVEVMDIKNMERLTMDTVRLDTRQVIAYRDLQGHERNLSLFPAAVEQEG